MAMTEKPVTDEEAIDAILMPWLREVESEYGTGINDEKKRPFIELLEAKAALNKLLKQREVAARIDEVLKVKSHHVYTGWAGTHALYQSSFNADDRLQQLKQEETNE